MGVRLLIWLEIGLPGVVLLDINMPGLTGLEVIRRLKADKELKYIPVIFVTANAELEDVTKGLDEGADDYSH